MDGHLVQPSHAHADAHWWFAVRRSIVLRAIGRFWRGPEPRILDVGCGGGFMLNALAEAGDVTGCDPDRAAVAAANARLGRQAAVVGALPDALPFEPDSFDIITLLDVLEYVDSPVESLACLYALLRPGGLLLCTVPACDWLWPQRDRRPAPSGYSADRLSHQLQAAGFHLLRATHFNTLLLPAVAGAHRVAQALGQEWSVAGPAPPPAVNAALRAVFSLEAPLLGALRFPFGLSIMAVARRAAAWARARHSAHPNELEPSVR